MSDQFGRHNSTRWAQAEVPSYDDWGADYDDDDQAMPQVAEEDEAASDPEPETAPVPNPLVLTIDEPAEGADSDNDSDFDRDPVTTPPRAPAPPPAPAITAPSSSSMRRKAPADPDSAPSTPVVGPPPVKVRDSPMRRHHASSSTVNSTDTTSTTDYDSDDSIQVEHSLNVASPAKRRSMLIDPNKVLEDIYDVSEDEEPQEKPDPPAAVPQFVINHDFDEKKAPAVPSFVINADYDNEVPESKVWGKPAEQAGPPAIVVEQAGSPKVPQYGARREGNEGYDYGNEGYGDEPYGNEQYGNEQSRYGDEHGNKQSGFAGYDQSEPRGIEAESGYSHGDGAESKNYQPEKYQSENYQSENYQSENYQSEHNQSSSSHQSESYNNSQSYNHSHQPPSQPSDHEDHGYHEQKSYVSYYSEPEEPEPTELSDLSRELDQTNSDHPGSYRNSYDSHVSHVSSSSREHDDTVQLASDNSSKTLDREPATSQSAASQPASTEPGPLKLSFDDAPSDSDSDDDRWGHQSDDDWGHQSDSDDDDAGEDPTPELNIVKSSESAVASPRHPVNTDMLDTLMHDIENVSYGDSSDDSGPQRNPKGLSIDTSRPADETDLPTGGYGSAFAQYLEQEWNDDPSQSASPITPLSPSQSVSMHESFVRTMSDRRSSVRKPPGARQALVSMDYSHIADAVSGYMDDKPQTPDADARHPLANDSVKSSPESLRGPDEPSLKDAMDDAVDAPVPPRPNFSADSRRSSAHTLGGFGAWKPNTSTFRDKFIADNSSDEENDCHSINNANYRAFTQQRQSSVASTAPSLPETVDVAMPAIDEDDDSEGDTIAPRMSTDTYGSSVLDSAPPMKPVFHEEKLTPNPSLDHVPGPPQKYSSLLGNEVVPEENEPEEKTHTRSASDGTLEGDRESRASLSSLTPGGAAESSVAGASGASVPGAGSSQAAGTQDHPSTGAMGPRGSVSSTAAASFRPKPYPVSDWKGIMSTSQPIDRIRKLKDALDAEFKYDTGLEVWLVQSLRQADASGAPAMQNGRIATEAYQNAPHMDIRRHNSINTMQVIGDVKDRVQAAAPAARSLGKKFLSKSKNLMKKGA
ncbi:hypothetical protein DICA1_F12134 [Diutina catenulata]